MGLAAVNTGNNLLFLLLGALLGLVALSGILSERVVRRVEVVRRLPRGVPAGVPARVRYEISNPRRFLPLFTLEIREPSLPGVAFLPHLPAGGTTQARNDPTFVRRGTVPLDTVTVATGFPFGLFRKERDLSIPGELVVWPPTDRAVPPLAPGGERVMRVGAAPGGGVAPRGDYRSLREFRSGDNPRDIHWKASARTSRLMTREYERDDAASLWICLDPAAPPGERAEEAVELAAALSARALREGRRVGFATPRARIAPSSGEGQLERILDALARVDFVPGASFPAPPAAPERCLLVSATGRGVGAFGQWVVAGSAE